MAKVIEFYVPDFFPKAVSITRTEPGKVIEFRLPRGKGLVVRFRESPADDPHAKEVAVPMWTFCKMPMWTLADKQDLSLYE